jgi:hypothetical protein
LWPPSSYIRLFFFSSNCILQASSRASTPSRSTGPVYHEHPSEDGTERESLDVIALPQVRFTYFPFLRFCCHAETVFPSALMLTKLGNNPFRFEQVPDASRVEANSTFTAYNSVLSRYPFLSGRSLGPQEQVEMPNLKRLRMQAAARYMTESKMENARICQFEVPGFGECRDTGCGDMHLSQVQVEPNGAPRPLKSCLFRHRHLIGSTISGLVWLFFSFFFFLQMSRLRTISAGMRM